MIKRGVLFLVLILFSFNLIVGVVVPSQEVLGGSSGSGVSFIVSPPDMGCVANSNSSYWLNASSGISELTLNVSNLSQPTASCFKYSASTNSSCCPSGYTCSGSGSCEKINPSINLCGQITTQNECNYGSAFINTSNEVITLSNNNVSCGFVSAPFLINGVSCQNVTDCSCGWSSNKCNVGWKTTTVCNDPFYNSNSGCTWTQTAYEDKCDSDGKVIVTYNASGTNVGSLTCQNKVIEYPCSATVKLPFFSVFNLISTLLAISLIYIFWRKK